MLNHTSSNTKSISINQIYDNYKRHQYSDAGELISAKELDGEIIFLSQIETVAQQTAPQVSIIKEVYLLGKHALVLSRRGHVLRESVVNSYMDEAIKVVDIVEISEKNTILKEGEFLSLCGCSCDSFWHWIMEYVPRIIHARMAGFKGTYLVSPLAPKFVFETLSLLGIDRGRIQAYDGQPWLLESLFVPQRIPASDHLFSYPGVIKALRDTMLSICGVISSSPKKRIYISRMDARQGRRTTNELQATELLQKYDFEIICMSALPLREQINLTANSDIIVGPHGAGLTHSLFMPERSLVIEMFSPEFISPRMLPVVDYLKHRYHMVLPQVHGKNYKNGPDVIANLPLIETILRTELY